jgi:putative FmdB family regulatory protein
MPIYEFQCTACGEVFEKDRPREQVSARAKCPACGARARRIFSRFLTIGGPSNAGRQAWQSEARREATDSAPTANQ